MQLTATAPRAKSVPRSNEKSGLFFLEKDHGGRQMALVRGMVSSVVFRDPQTDWSVLTVRTDRRRVRVLGHTSAQEGQYIVAEGVYLKKNPQTGWKNEILEEIKAQRIVATSPRSAKGIVAFLAANVRGVGPVLGQRIAQAVGDRLFDVLQNGDTEALQGIKGVSPVIIERIFAFWQEQQAVAEIMLFLHDQDLSAALCRRIYRRYGDQAKQVIQTNPYLLAKDVRGIGFAKADAIAKKLAIPANSPFRLQAGLLHVLEEASTRGDCGLREEELIKRAQASLQVSEDDIRATLRDMLQDDQSGVELDRGCVWLKWLLDAERYIAKRLRRAVSFRPRWQSAIKDIDLAIERAQQKAGITLAEAQLHAVRMALSNHVSIITGGPGCGKTTTLNVVLQIFREHGISYHLAAPTGKAAQRASQATGQPASTLHRLLKIGPDGVGVEISPDVLVIDEASMVDVPLMRQVLDGVAFRTSIIIVGDVDQLPSVGPGSVLLDLIKSGVIPFTKLTVVHRQGKGSLIIDAAHAVNSGRMPLMQRSDGDFFFINEKREPRLAQALQEEQKSFFGQTAREILLELVCQRLPARYGFDPIADIMVLSPMNNGQCGVRTLNTALQQALNPAQPSMPTWRVGDVEFRVGDKVIQTRNNYDLGVFNGDTGRIVGIDEEEKVLRIDYDGRVVEHPFDDADELRLAYCITVHKSQGSQAPCVVIPVLTEHFTLLQRNLLYTGITRAQRLCVLVGSTKAVAMAVRRADATERLTSLKFFLQENLAN
jgi:exodeoxyribonuclease V alpha subunit